MQVFSKYKDIALKVKLSDVKQTDNGENDVLIIPSDCTHEMELFFDAYGIEYAVIENPKLYPKEEIYRQLERYCEPTWVGESGKEVYETIGADAIISKFDADALFEWSLQLFSMENQDPAYEAFLEAEREQAKKDCDAYGY